MGKLKIEFTGEIFECQHRVMYADTDAGAVVYYGNYLRYFEKGRTEFMRSCGLTYRELEDSGFVMPVVENYVRYKASARYDDLLTIQTVLAEISRVSCRFNYKIMRADDNKMLVKGFTVNAVVNHSGKLVKFPDKVLTLLQKNCMNP